jgi:hypothetical protein
LYQSALEREFLGWWEETEYGQKLNGDGQSQIKWSTESRHADVWKHFDQVADIDSGLPRVFCQACLTLLDHPQYKKKGQALWIDTKSPTLVARERKEDLIKL